MVLDSAPTLSKINGSEQICNSYCYKYFYSRGKLIWRIEEGRERPGGGRLRGEGEEVEQGRGSL